MNTSEEYLVEFLKSKGVDLSAGEVKDFQLLGDETPRQIEGYAYDYISDLHSEACEASHMRKMGNYYE